MRQRKSNLSEKKINVLREKIKDNPELLEFFEKFIADLRFPDNPRLTPPKTSGSFVDKTGFIWSPTFTTN